MTLFKLSTYQSISLPLIISMGLTACVNVVSDTSTANTNNKSLNSTPSVALSRVNGTFDKPGNIEEPDGRHRAKIRLELASNYFQSQQNKIALDEVNSALSADPDFVDAHILKGLILMEAKQNTSAEASFKTALTLNSSDGDANNTYGWFLCQTNRITQALVYFDKAAVTPFYSTPFKPLLNAGMCAMKINNYTQAEKYFLRAQVLDDTSALLSYHTALLYFNRNDLARAMAYIRKNLSLTVPTADTLWLGIKIAKKTNDLVALNQWIDLLRDNFITSPQWALYIQNRFND